MKKIFLFFVMVLVLNAQTIKDATKSLDNEDYKGAYTTLKSLEKNNNKDVLFELARMYDYGCWVRQNLSEAVKYYKKAAALGHIEAKYNLGMIYYLGEENIKTTNDEGKPTGCNKFMDEKDDVKPSLAVVKSDDKEALNWFRKAEKDGFNEAKNSINLICDSKPEICKQK